MRKAKTYFQSRSSTLAILTFLIVSIAPCVGFVGVRGGSGGTLDLFTQKTPFNGIGPNQTSDAFEPMEKVTLYTLVTYNDGPIANKLASFVVTGPANPYQNITIIGVNMTNSSGIAEFSFRVPWPAEHAEEIVFGVWHAIGTADIHEVSTSDYMDFRVGWIAGIKSITTLNDRFEPQTSFLRRSTVIFSLEVENIALTPIEETILINVQDEAHYPIMRLETTNLTLLPGITFVHSSSQIPIEATLGQANASAALYNLPPEIGAPAHSPFSVTFQIIGREFVMATIDIKPETLNLKSKGNWITAYVELPEGYNVADINVSTVLLNGTIPAELTPTAIGDYDGNGVPDLMVKFDRTQVIRYILDHTSIEGRFSTVTLTLMGSLNDGMLFEGSDTIRVIMPNPKML
jgi:hypothetical protein